MSKKQKARGEGKGQQEQAVANGAEVDGEALADEALEPKADHRSVEERVADLSPEEAAIFNTVLEITMKRRRLMLIGYLLALVAVLVGMMWALYMYGARERGTFVGWVFMVPPALAAMIIILFGRLAGSVGK